MLAITPPAPRPRRTLTRVFRRASAHRRDRFGRAGRLAVFLAAAVVALAPGAASASAATGALAWGINAGGQLGNGTTTDSHSPGPVSAGAIPAGAVITQMSGGYEHTLALSGDGNAYAWGGNGYGQLGDGTTTSSGTPVGVSRGAIPAGVSITQIAAGGYHNLALGSDGRVYAWGQGTTGQLGDGASTTALAPVAVAAGAIPAGVSITEVAAGTFQSLALGSDGHVYAWGANAEGQLGNGNTPTAADVPVAVSAGAIPSGVTIAQIAAGGDHSLALGSDGRVYAWGYDGDGEVGNGTTTARVDTPAQVLAGAIPAGVSITRIAGGSNHSLALGNDGHVYAWGRDGDGELGDATTTDSSVPVAVAAGSVPPGVSITQIAAGDHHSLALGDDGHAYAWGANTFGQLGDGTTTGSSVPAVVAQPAGSTIGVIGSGAAANHSLAVLGTAQPAHPTSTSVSCSPSSLTVAGSSACTVTVSDTSPSGAGTPRGSAAVAISGTSGGSLDRASCLLLAGPGPSASCTVTYTPAGAGSEMIAASYPAGSSFAASQGATTVTVAAGSVGGGGAGAGGGPSGGGGAGGGASLAAPTVPSSCQAAAVSPAGVTVSATVNPRGLPTSVHFGYGRTVAYGGASPDRQLAAGSQDDQISAVLGGLEAGSTYHCRAVATSPAGITYGSDETFTVPRAAANLRLRSARPRAMRARCPARSSHAARACGAAIVTLSGTIDTRADGEWIVVRVTAVARLAGTMTITTRTKATAGRWQVGVTVPGGRSPSGQRWRLEVSYRGDTHLQPARAGRGLRIKAAR